MALNESRIRFRVWLERNAPQLKLLWDWEEESLSLEAVERYLVTASHGEAAMCRFAVGVWMGRNEQGFNLIEAAEVLDKEQRDAIATWLVSPFWPNC